MLIILFAFIACINAVEYDQGAFRSVVQSAQRLGRMSGNQQNTVGWTNKLVHSQIPKYKSMQKVWASKGRPDNVFRIEILPYLTFNEAISAKVIDEEKLIKFFAFREYIDHNLKHTLSQHIIGYIVRDLGNQQISAGNSADYFATFLNTAKSNAGLSLSNDQIDQIYKFGKLRAAIGPTKLIQYFCSRAYNDAKLQDQIYQEIMDYIFRDLGNQEISDFIRINYLELFLTNLHPSKLGLMLPIAIIRKIFQFGKLNLLKYLVEHQNFFEQFKSITYLPFSLAAGNGHLEMVKWILEDSPSLIIYKFSIIGSITQNQKQTLETIVETSSKENRKFHMDVLNEALGYSFLHNRIDYVSFVLKKVSDSFEDSNTLSQWGERFIKMYARKRWNPTVENLDYFFSQTVWKPRTVSSILLAMSKASKNVVERIGMELLNPRFNFDDSQGFDPLEKAIEIASHNNDYKIGKLIQVLQDIQRKRFEFSTE